MTNKHSKRPSSGAPVWFITGCSTGFGRELAAQSLARGFRTVVTARRPDDVRDIAAHGESLVLELDVTKQDQIDAAVATAEKTFGGIDVLVNNAGVGYFGAVEESDENAVRRMFEINFFGVSRMIRAALPGMRRRSKGVIVNFSSLAGLVSFPSVGYYSATKFAVEGLSEALAQEVAPLGIKVLVVEPSGFRTDWAGRSAEETKSPIDDYAQTADAWRLRARKNSGHQPGDPVRAARAVLQVVDSAHIPPHLLLGNNAYDAAAAKLAALSKLFKSYEKISRAADFPQDERVAVAATPTSARKSR
jgi:NAD(P)-dependent dehydrogenase (short-subunit alcohol dehydrogenase family)